MEAQTWPSWRYGPDDQARICSGPDDVPKGWTDHPSAHPDVPAGPTKAELEYAEKRQAEDDEEAKRVAYEAEAAAVKAAMVPTEVPTVPQRPALNQGKPHGPGEEEISAPDYAPAVPGEKAISKTDKAT